MKVYLTGATGFVGSYILRRLLDEGHAVRCLTRDPDRPLPAGGDEVEKVKGDVTQPKSLAGTMRGCDACIHLVGIIEEHPSRGVTFEKIHFEGTQHVVAEAVDAGVERFIHMSANGAREDGVSAYQTSKWKAEQVVKNAGFAHWAIFCPSIVFGDPGPDNPEFATELARTLVRPFPVWPVFGDGRFPMQPVSAEEVAAAFVQALTSDVARHKRYCVAGKDRFPFIEILDRIAGGLGVATKPKIPQPLWLIRPIIKTVGHLNVLPISPDQFEMLVEGNVCDSEAFYDDFDLDYKPFTAENLAYLRERA